MTKASTSEQKHYLIFGGGGFIGTFLTRYLIQKNFRVSVIGRSNVPFPVEGVHYFSLQVYTLAQIAALLQETPVNVAIDLAYGTLPNTSYANPVRDFSENLGNIIHYLDFVLALDVEKYVYVSSGGTVYGDSENSLPLQESDLNYPVSPYGISKMACERYVLLYHKIHHLPAFIVRPSNIYGPGQKPCRGQGVVATVLGLSYQGKPIEIFGTGSNIRDYLFIEDFCEGLFSILESGSVGGIYNIGSGKGLSISELLIAIEKVIGTDGYSLERNYLPERPFDVHYNVLNIDKVRSDTGWVPKSSLETGLAETWKWLQTFMINNRS